MSANSKEMKRLMDNINSFPDILRDKFHLLMVFKSGIEANKIIIDIARELIFHKETKKHYNNFIAKGGTFLLKNMVNNVNMSYSRATKIISVSPKYLWQSVYNYQMEKLAASFAHELHHDYVSDRNEKAGHLLFLRGYDNASVQIDRIGTEMAELYNQTIISFEAGGRYWHNLSKKRPNHTKYMENLFEHYKIYPGDKMPKYFYPFIANASILSFSISSTASEYKKQFVSAMKRNPKFARGNKSLLARDFFHNANIPTTFSEQQLKSLILISPFEKNEITITNDIKNDIEYTMQSKPENLAKEMKSVKVNMTKKFLNDKKLKDFTKNHDVNQR